MKTVISHIVLVVSTLILPSEILALDTGANYRCVSTIMVSYFRPDDRVDIRRGEDAGCITDIYPSKKTWSTNCFLSQILENYDEVDLLTSENKRGDSKIMLVATNKDTAVIKTANIWGSHDSSKIVFTLTNGGNANHGTCTIE